VSAGDKGGGADPRPGIKVVGQVGNEAAAGQQIQLETSHTPPQIERLLVQDDAARQQRVGKGRKEIEISQVAVVSAEIVELCLASAHMESGIRFTAPAVGANVKAVERPAMRVDDCEVGAQQLGSRSQVHDAAVGVEAPGDVGSPA